MMTLDWHLLVIIFHSFEIDAIPLLKKHPLSGSQYRNPFILNRFEADVCHNESSELMNWCGKPIAILSTLRRQRGFTC